MATEEFDGCPHCHSQINFAFGTCGSCGYNHLDKRFRWVKVLVEDLDSDDDILVHIHADRTRHAHSR